MWEVPMLYAKNKVLQTYLKLYWNGHIEALTWLAFDRQIDKHLFVFFHEVTSLYHECKVAPENPELSS
jgi:hypothetical protein